jgi:hypothetical protein
VRWDGMGWNGARWEGMGSGAMGCDVMGRDGKWCDGVRWGAMGWDGVGWHKTADERFSGRDGTGKWMGLAVSQRRASACAFRCTLSACLKSQPSECFLLTCVTSTETVGLLYTCGVQLRQSRGTPWRAPDVIAHSHLRPFPTHSLSHLPPIPTHGRSRFEYPDKGVYRRPSARPRPRFTSTTASH